MILDYYSAFIPCSSRSLRRRVFSLERALTSLVSASILSDWNFSWIIASSRVRQRSRMTKSELDRYIDSAVEFMDGLSFVIILISSHVVVLKDFVRVLFNLNPMLFKELAKPDVFTGKSGELVV